MEDVSKYMTTKITRWDGIRNDWLNPMTRQIVRLADDVFESTYQKRVIKDNKLSHCGLAVLHWSKVRLLEFIYFLEAHLIEGSYKICYLGKEIIIISIHVKQLLKTPTQSLSQPQSLVICPPIGRTTSNS